MATMLDRSGARSAETSGSWSGVALCAVLHAAVDAGCGVLLWTAVRDGVIAGSTAWSAFLLYNLLAFAVQPLLGLAVDRLGAASAAVIAGSLAVAAGLVLFVLTGAFVPALLLAGLGNAVFHIGGGTLSLRLQPGRATAPGLFVAPGAAGVAIGILAGKAGAPAWPFVLALVALALALTLLRRAPAGSARAGASAADAGASWSVAARAGTSSPPASSSFELVLALVLFAVAARSYVGLALALPWKSDVTLLVALTAGVVLGKALGGIAADRFGWRLVACGALVVAAPLLAVGAQIPAAGIAGMAVFNMTMPVTLAAAARLLPGHEGFAFGLTCLALFCGALPVFAGWTPPLSAPVLVAASAVAAVALWWALGERREPRPAREPARPAAPEEGSYV